MCLAPGLPKDVLPMTYFFGGKFLEGEAKGLLHGRIFAIFLW
jgi:hypothetical protein